MHVGQRLAQVTIYTNDCTFQILASVLMYSVQHCLEIIEIFDDVTFVVMCTDLTNDAIYERASSTAVL